MKKVSLYVDAKLWEAFRILCLQRHISASKQVTHFIQEHLRAAERSEQRPAEVEDC